MLKREEECSEDLGRTDEQSSLPLALGSISPAPARVGCCDEPPSADAAASSLSGGVYPELRFQEWSRLVLISCTLLMGFLLTVGPSYGVASRVK